MSYYKDPELNIYYKIIKKFKWKCYFGSEMKILAQADKQVKVFCNSPQCPKLISQLCANNSHLLCFSASYIKKYWKKVSRLEAILLDLNKKFKKEVIGDEKI